LTKPKDPNMVEMSVLVPKSTRNALQRIWATRGLTISQQVRHSLALWIRAHEKDPDALSARVAARELAAVRARTDPDAPRDANGKLIDLDNDPEPDRAQDPVAWSKWAARQGNKAIKELAKGQWPTAKKVD
jgi:hypothetical protein